MPPTTTGSTVSNNDPNFKFKYPQARPTPPGVDDTEWNKLFTAADSRFYNKAQKNAIVSKAKRESGDTYTLALQMLKEKRDKATGKANTKATTSSNTGVPALSTSTPRAPITQRPQTPNEATSSREDTPAAMDMAERIKIEGRARKTASGAPSPERDTPAPPPAPKTSSAPKPQKPGPKKGIAAPSKKQQDKKPLSKVQNKGMSC
jgi:COMPASS component SPP1